MFEAVSLFAAAAADSLFITGWFFLGTAVMATAVPIYSLGETSIVIVVSACAAGSFSGSIIGFFVGRTLSHTPYVAKFLAHEGSKRAAARLQRSGSTVSVVFIGKFVGLLRPFYSLILGAANTRVTTYLMSEILASLIWSSVWSVVLYLGAEAISDIIWRLL